MHGHHHTHHNATNATAYPTNAIGSTAGASSHIAPPTTTSTHMHSKKSHGTTHAPTTAATAHPNRVHAGIQGMVGSMQSAVGRMTHNPHTIIKGEEKKVAAKTEADLAKLRNAKKHANIATNI